MLMKMKVLWHRWRVSKGITIMIDYPTQADVKIRRREIKPGHDRVVLDIFPYRKVTCGGSGSKALGAVSSP